jgi:hypothetical protein
MNNLILNLVVTTGAHQKTYVFGTITIDGRQLIIQAVQDI